MHKDLKTLSKELNQVKVEKLQLENETTQRHQITHAHKKQQLNKQTNKQKHKSKNKTIDNEKHINQTIQRNNTNI